MITCSIGLYVSFTLMQVKGLKRCSKAVPREEAKIFVLYVFDVVYRISMCCIS